MGCTELYGGVHTAQRQTPTRIFPLGTLLIYWSRCLFHVGQCERSIRVVSDVRKTEHLD